ncbi:Sensor histidine kinase regulating citrate/malate metabolism [Natronoarchaeum philippinense]|uniref:histidine kinase n=1 Tax=Natronoarchaeum philippinense TaxID=558529 RepID=A0A285N5K2_NATPI|nr:histidine kinase N-terminal 7TM domain-containing protein [Natronoarchaeum philippinense]SNZ04137.1 Sensor histidine kinase regulating citrate/malate metabolism [Natronoarchaeum philippinense]
MALEYTHYVVPYVLALLVSVALVARLWRYRDRRGATGFIFDVAGLILLSAVYIVQLVSTDLSAKLFWWNWRFVPMTFMAAGYMITAIEYTDHEEWLTYRTGAAIAAVPVLSQLLVWTNDAHGLFYGYEYDAAANLLVPHFGPLYWLFASVAVGYLIVGIYLLLDLSLTQRAFLKQSTILVGSIVLVLVGEAVWWLGLVPIDPLPLTSTVKVVGFLFGVARFELLDIVPVARNKVIENMRDGVFVVDRTGRVVDVNEAGRRLAARPEPVRRPISDVLDAEVPAVGEGEGEERSEIELTVEGERRQFDFRITPLYDDSGARSGRLLVFRDITELKQREEELSILNRIVRHDIRNDMTVIKGRGELLDEHVDDGQPHLDAMTESAEHVIELTENVGNLMASITGEATVDVEPVDVGALLRRQVTQASQQFDDAEFEVEGEIPYNCRVEANEMLSSVFTNLFNNAVQHNDGPTPTVHVRAECDDSAVHIEIADDGPGIPADRREEIFGRGEKGLDSTGTGVGLYLVDTLVEQYGGSIEVTDSAAGGALFRITLPLADAESRPVATEPT